MINFSKYKHFIWDWNGTLLDDGWLFVEIMNSILITKKMNPITLNDYRKLFCFPIEDYYIKLGFDFTKKSFKQYGLEFIKEYKKRNLEANLFPNTIRILNKLNTMGISNSILSAQHQSILTTQIQHYKIQYLFTDIIGLDNHYAKSKINNGIKWINSVKFNLDEILMIGDTKHDFESAEKMGIDCLLISHGHNNYERLKKTNTIIFSSLNDIYKLLND